MCHRYSFVTTAVVGTVLPDDLTEDMSGNLNVCIEFDHFLLGFSLTLDISLVIVILKYYYFNDGSSFAIKIQ